MKYLAMSSRGRRSYRWIDLQRDFPVRLETEDGTVVALENIVDAPQPSSLFAIPPDYHKFDPAQLIEIDQAERRVGRSAAVRLFGACSTILPS